MGFLGDLKSHITSAESPGRVDSKDVFAADGGIFEKRFCCRSLYVSGSREAGNASAGVLRSCNGDVARTSLLIVFGSPGSRTLGSPVAQQRSIASSSHRVGIAKQSHDGMANRGYLPVIPLHPRKTEDDPGDLLLGGAIPEPSNACSIWRIRLRFCRVRRVSGGTARP